MQFQYGEPPEFGYYREPEFYGYYAEPPEVAGWSGMGQYGVPGYGEYEPVDGYGEPPDFGYYAEADPFGYYAEPDYGEWDAADPYGISDYPPYGPVGFYAEPSEFSEMEPVGYYADEYPVGGYGEGGELVGWGAYAPGYEGYVREIPPAFNPGCPMPTNVAGFGDASFEGYVRPAEVNAICEGFTPQPSVTVGVPDTFRPLW